MSIITLLSKKYEDHKRLNAHFSKRAFAKKLGISSGALTDILKGNRLITDLLIRKWLQSSFFDTLERSRLAELGGFIIHSSSKPCREEQFVKLSSEQFRVISDWWHFAILSLIKIKGFKSEPRWIASRLGIPENTIKEALIRLSTLNLISRNNKNEWIRNHASIRTPDDQQLDLAIQMAHTGLLEIAIKKIKDTSIEKRDFTSTLLSIDPSKIAEAKKIIRRFQDEISETLESGEAKEVYQLGIQLFPISK